MAYVRLKKGRGKSLRSRGTTGQQVSVVPFNKKTSVKQTKALASIL